MILANLLGINMCLWRQCLDLSAGAVPTEQFREATAREIEGFGIFSPEAFFQLQN